MALKKALKAIKPFFLGVIFVLNVGQEGLYSYLSSEFLQYVTWDFVITFSFFILSIILYLNTEHDDLVCKAITTLVMMSGVSTFVGYVYQEFFDVGAIAVTLTILAIALLIWLWQVRKILGWGFLCPKAS